jgi:hypothetical protein
MEEEPKVVHRMIGKQILQRDECYVISGEGCGHRVENFIPIYGICKILAIRVEPKSNNRTGG